MGSSPFRSGTGRTTQQGADAPQTASHPSTEHRRTSPSHRITVCTSCKHKGTHCQPGYDLIAKLRAAIDAAGETIGDDFAISGVACMAGCDRPCTVAYHGTRKATYLFGDIEADTDIDDLVAFARQYAVLGDGWCSSVDRPGKLRRTTLARVPAAMIVLEDSDQRP